MKITYRGWAGHFICSRYCAFRLNTLVEDGDIRIIVSTVGCMVTPQSKKFEEIASGRYYETMAFHAHRVEGDYWDADVTRQVSISGKWTVDKINKQSDAGAQQMHENAVQEIVSRIGLLNA